MLKDGFFLTEDELVRFTGYSQAKKQIAHLCKIGVPFELNSLTKPIVLREALLKKMSGSNHAIQYRKTEPKFSMPKTARKRR